jgi:hypothetical protein
MNVTQLIASLAGLPPDAIVRVFSVDEQDWMPINDIDHCAVLGVGERIDLRAYPQPDEDEDEDPMGSTYCERCANPLESGQIGLCDNCQN